MIVASLRSTEHVMCVSQRLLITSCGSEEDIAARQSQPSDETFLEMNRRIINDM